MLAASTVPPTSGHVSLRPATKKSAGPRTRRPIHTPNAVMPIVYTSSRMRGTFTLHSLSRPYAGLPRRSPLAVGRAEAGKKLIAPVQSRKVSTGMLASIALLLPLMTVPAQAPQPAAPPPKPFDCTAPEHRQFDFWVGEWDVVPNPETRPANAPPQPGRKPAINIIEKAHNGCVIIENWNDGQGGTGQSFN